MMIRRTGNAAATASIVVIVLAVLAGGAYLAMTGGTKTGGGASTGSPTGAVQNSNSTSAAAQPAPAPKAPDVNVVIFLIDTLRANRLGAYGYDKHANSPNIDRLASEGVVFEQACAAAPWTLPSIASLATSKYPCEHGTLHHRSTLPKDLTPLAVRMKRAGFATAGLYANSFASEKFGMDRGYDVYHSSPRNEGTKVGAVLSELGRDPYFLYVHNLEPHNPYLFAPPHTPGLPDVDRTVRKEIEAAYKEYKKLSRADFVARQPLGTTDNTAEQDAQMAILTSRLTEYSDLYDASVTYADSLLGSAIARLIEAGTWDRTLFVLMADHGEEMNDHGGWVHDHTVYEELMHVPLIVKFPHGEFAGKRIKTPVSTIDIMPTLGGYLKLVSLGEDVSGRDLMPLVRGDEVDESDTFRVVGMRENEAKYYRPSKELRGDINIVIRRGSWKGIWNVEPNTMELFDLASDPGEQHNVAAENAELADAMRGFARKWLEECKVRAHGREDAPEAEMDADTLRELSAIGYADAPDDDEDIVKKPTSQPTSVPDDGSYEP